MYVVYSVKAKQVMSSYQEARSHTHTVHMHAHIDLQLRAPCWHFLGRCHYTIKRKPSGNRLSTTSCMFPWQQTSFFSWNLRRVLTQSNFLQKDWETVKTKEAGVFGCSAAPWLLSFQLGVGVTSDPQHLATINICGSSLDGLFLNGLSFREQPSHSSPRGTAGCHSDKQTSSEI